MTDALLRAAADELDMWTAGPSYPGTVKPVGAARYYDDPVGFVTKCINWPPGRGLTPYQSEVLAAIPVKKRVSVRGPHGLGKSSLSAFAILWFALTREAAKRDWKCVTTAGAWQQLIQFLWPEIRKWARMINWDEVGRPEFDQRSEMLSLNIKLRYGSAFAVASDNAVLIEGAHADSIMYVFDESKAVAAETFDAAEGAFSGAGEGSSNEAFALAMSTPGEPSGRFYDIHRRKKGLEEWWPRHVTKEEAIAAGRMTSEWCAQKYLLWGDSALYHNKVEGNFYSGDEDGLIPILWVEAANLRWTAWHAAGAVLPADGMQNLGVDVARTGGDKTVMALRYGDIVAETREWSKQDTMATTGHAKGILDKNPEMTPVVDVIGIGAGVVDRLREQKHQVVAFNASEKTNRKDQTGEMGFVNKRSAGYWALREELDPANDATLALPPNDELLGDLTAMHWRVISGGKIQVESKDDIKKRLQRSTDYGDAVMMAGWPTSAQWEKEYGVIVCEQCSRPFLSELHPETCPNCRTPWRELAAAAA